MKKSSLSGFMLALALGAGALALSSTQAVFAASDSPAILSTGLIVPEMDAALGRELFATKGCAVCHSVNGIGGEDAPPLDAEYMDAMMNPFEFATRMWRAADAMRAMQRSEWGDVIDLTGEELAAITAFVHDPQEQAKYTKDDWSEKVADLIAEAQAGGG
ncbi:hypothetical protein MNBD_ALPHA12-750 [hydrothermal vent metagenome]|uniref:Cytochrome c domain-containing protein n=1 Tax=hydrothermal vent metagenome TaxID=652676 RepID=A0A3B0THN9_9ZZZZ